METIIYVIFFGVFIVHILYTSRSNKVGRFFTKPLLMPLLLVLYIVKSDKLDIFVVLALVCGLLGDIFLMWPQKQNLLISGLISFLAGHVLYIYIFLRSSSFPGNIPLWFYLLIAPYLGFVFVTYTQLNPYLGKMRIPFIAYTLVIITMSLSSLTRAWLFCGAEFYLPFIGSILFILSDSILAFNLFKTKIKNSDVFVMVTYVFAQFFIISGLLS